MEIKREDRVSSEVCSLNFSFLTNTYGKSYGVRMGRKILNQAAGENNIGLSELLRHHHQRKIRGAEVLQRESINELLSFYSIIEIAVLIGYIRVHPIGPQLTEVYRHLANPSLSQYYREHYPLNLPQGLLKRFESNSMATEVFEPTSTFPNFIRFLLLGQQNKDNEEIKAFFSMLDGKSEKASLDFKSILADPEKLLKVTGLKRSRNSQDKELRGYAEFIAFSVELDLFLQSISDFPLFQSACYQYHKNVYIHFGRQLSELTNTVASILSKDASGTDSRIREIERISGNKAMSRLITTQYAERYERALY